MARSVGRPLEKQIRSEFVLKLMHMLDCSTLGELALKTQLSRTTIDNWAYEDRSPLKGLEMTLKLLRALGKDKAAQEVSAILDLLEDETCLK